VNNILQWTSENQALATVLAGIVTTLAGIATAVATACIAWLTGTLARENRRLRKAGTEPEVVAYLMPDPRSTNMLNFVLANIGQGPARNVRFSFECDQQDFAAHKVRLINNANRTATSVLPQGERLVAFFGVGHELLHEPRLKPFSVRVEYEDLARKRRTVKCTLDISQFVGLTATVH
jgi:hypothetical protein